MYFQVSVKPNKYYGNAPEMTALFPNKSTANWYKKHLERAGYEVSITIRFLSDSPEM